MLMSKRKKKPARDVARSRRQWAEALRAIRDELGITQVEMAERVGVSARTWISWENRQGAPGRLAQALLRQHFPELF